MRLNFLVVVACALAPRVAVADPDAIELFRQGRMLMVSGTYDAACAAFAAAYQLDADPATLLNGAHCEARRAHLATAARMFLEVARRTGPSTSESFAHLHQVALFRAASLARRVSHLRVAVPAEARVAGLEILVDLVPLDGATWGEAVAVDGGAHEITFRAPGSEGWSTLFTVASEDEERVIEIPALRVRIGPRPVSAAPTPPPR
jgi:hypothetical protein